VDNGRAPIQSRKKNSVRNRPFRLSKVQEVLPRSTKQEDDLGTPNTAQKKAKEVASNADVGGEGIKFTPPHSPIFQSLLIFSKVLVHLFFKHFFEFLKPKVSGENKLSKTCFSEYVETQNAQCLNVYLARVFRKVFLLFCERYFHC